MMDVRERIQDALSAEISHISHLSGGCVGDVRKVELSDGRRVVAKIGSGETSDLALEGFMLTYLAENSSLPVPEVLVATESLLIMDYIEGDDPINASAQCDAARHLAALHDISSPTYGFNRDTLIGGLRQPNSEGQSWIPFFRDHRLPCTWERSRITRVVSLLIFCAALKLCVPTWANGLPNPRDHPYCMVMYGRETYL